MIDRPRDTGVARLARPMLAVAGLTALTAAGIGCDRSPSAEGAEKQTGQADRQPPDETETAPDPPLAGVSASTFRQFIRHHAVLRREVTEDARDRAARLETMVDYAVAHATDDAVAAVRQAHRDLAAALFPLRALGAPDENQKQEEREDQKDPPLGRRWRRLVQTGDPEEFWERKPPETKLARGASETDGRGHAAAGLDAIDALLSGADAETFGDRHSEPSSEQIRRRRWLKILSDTLHADLKALYRHAKTRPQAAGEDALSLEERTRLAGEVLEAMREASRASAPGTTARPGRRLRYLQRGVRAMWSGTFERDDNSELTGTGLQAVLREADAVPVDDIDAALEATKTALRTYPTHRQPLRSLKPPEGRLSEEARAALERQRELLAGALEAITVDAPAQ